jgi:MYXO-CTERM domain-containing protein
VTATERIAKNAKIAKNANGDLNRERRRGGGTFSFSPPLPVCFSSWRSWRSISLSCSRSRSLLYPRSMLRVAALILSLLLVATPAFGQEAADAGSGVVAAEAELDTAVAAAHSEDCREACRALESMRRAMLRLCALDPGDACARAKAKVSDATKRVRDACPECEAAHATGATVPPPPAPAPADVQRESAAPTRPGCGGCRSAPGSSVSAPVVASALFALALLRRRKKR